MNTRPLILAGILSVLAVITVPFLYLRVSPGSLAPPTLELPPAGELKCVEGREYMRERHMRLLKDWRKSAVRADHHDYVASDGKHYDMTFTTCFNCHSNKADFCDRCHEYVPVRPGCWKCHPSPQKRTATK